MYTKIHWKKKEIRATGNLSLKEIIYFLFFYLSMRIFLLAIQFSHMAVSNCLRPHEAQQASLSISNFQSLLKLLSIESVMPSNHLILCCPLLLLPSISHSIRVFSNELVLYIKWPKYWSPCNEYSGLISFRIN